jgi:hypothetical protein
MSKRLPAALILTVLVTACGGGGGGGTAAAPGAATPAPAPAASSAPAASFTAATGAVTALAATASNSFGSTLLAASNDGTFIVQSPETPLEISSPNPSLPEYTVSGTEAAGQSTSAFRRSVQSDGVLPRRPLLDRYSMENPTRLAVRAHPLARAPGDVRVARSARRPQSANLGDAHQFYVDYYKITGASATCPTPVTGYACYVTVPAHLLGQTAHTNVWIDDSVAAGTAYGLGTTQAQAAANQFESDYGIETVAYGPAFISAATTPTFEQCDTSGNALPNASYGAPPDLTNDDPHVNVLVTNALEGNGEGGYFSFGNLLSEPELECASPGNIEKTNQMKLFIAGADGYQTVNASGGTTEVYDSNYWLSYDMPRTIAHEFQHYLHALNKYFVPALVTNTGGVLDDAFVDEGCSMLAEDITLPGAPNAQSQDASLLAFFYLYEAGNFSLTSFSGYAADPLSTATNPPYIFVHNDAGDYGQAYLFMRYLYDRFGGNAALQRIYADVTPTPQVRTSANVSPIVAAANGEPFAQVYGEFAAALELSGTGTTTDPRYTFNAAVHLRGQMNYAQPGSVTVFANFQGPRSPEDLTSATPGSAARIKFTPGGTVSAKLLRGATLFFNAANAATGATVRASIAGAPAGSPQAILTQGAYSDSPGACAAAQPSTTCSPTTL